MRSLLQGFGKFDLTSGEQCELRSRCVREILRNHSRCVEGRALLGTLAVIKRYFVGSGWIWIILCTGQGTEWFQDASSSKYVGRSRTKRMFEKYEIIDG